MTIEQIVNESETIISRYGFSVDEIDSNFALLATRENGDVGNEISGVEDRENAVKMVKEIKAKFPDSGVKFCCESVDEWVHVEIREGD